MIFARKISIEARGSLAIVEVPVPLGSHARNDASKRTKDTGHPYSEQGFSKVNSNRDVTNNG